MSSAREPTWRDHLLGLGLCALYIVLLLRTADSIGLGRDEGIYVDAAQRYAGWLELLLKSPAQALERHAIDSAFTANHEHPPLMKLLFGLGYLAQRELHIFGTDSQSFRFAGMLSRERHTLRPPLPAAPQNRRLRASAHASSHGNGAAHTQ